MAAEPQRFMRNLFRRWCVITPSPFRPATKAGQRSCRGERDGHTMGKLYFHYSTMNAGKSTALLQANHNYLERGMKTHLLTAKLDDRTGSGGRIHSRIGITQPAEVFDGGTDLFALLAALSAREEIACVFVDEAQFLSKQQVWPRGSTVWQLCAHPTRTAHTGTHPACTMHAQCMHNACTMHAHGLACPGDRCGSSRARSMTWACL